MHESFSFRNAVKFTAMAMGLLLVLGYIVFQARYLIIGPQIVLSNKHSFLSNERQILLSGNAYNISRLWLNDRPIYTDVEGSFKETLVLENGYTIATLRAEDRYGRETKVSQSFVYIPASLVINNHF
jgi:hypothetical protein